MRTNLLELLGTPMPATAVSNGTVLTHSHENYDDDGVLPASTDRGTIESRTDSETYDEDAALCLVVNDIGTTRTATHESYDEDSLLPGT